jgi:hypothetical protein
MRTPPFLLLAVLLLGLAITACRPPQETARDGNVPIMVLVAIPDAPAVGPAEIEVVVQLEGEPVANASVEVTGDMTHAGMVPVVASAPETVAGTYRTNAFEFTMAGDWILTVDVELEDGRTASAEVPTTVARP